MRVLWKPITICTFCMLAACTTDAVTPVAPSPSSEDCVAAGDEDGNGFSDCDDPVCAAEPSCRAACGNGLLEPGEACDDGNTVNDDGCDANCTATVCGNGIVTTGETCDDGNAIESDGCDSTCARSVSAYLKAPDPVGHFGTSIASSADGSTVAVGAFDASGGVVYVFIRTRSTWSQQARIKASNAATADYFGSSVALSADGSTLAVGAPYEDSAATGVGGNQSDNSAENSGATYIFTRSGGMWSQQAYVKAPNTSEFSNFGMSVALSGDGSLLSVGAFGRGTAYTFTRSGITWSPQAAVSGPYSFGWRIALSVDGATMAVSAPLESSGASGIDGNESDGSAEWAGAVLVFKRIGAAWARQAYVKASNTDAGDNFGWSIALSADGSTLAVGAHREGSGATGIGGDQGNSSYAAGAAYVFTRTGITWSQQAYVKPSNTDSQDFFGEVVSLSADGSTMAVGAVGESSDATGVGGDQTHNSISRAGAVYVFTRSGAMWSQRSYVKASNPGSEDHFGWSIALSADASTLAVGANQEASAATSIGGNQHDNSRPNTGSAYVFWQNF